MNDLRKAAQMALECLDYHWDNPDTDLEDWPYVLEAKKALREALAEPANFTTNFVEPEASSQTEQEPVGYAHVEDLNREHHDFYVNRQQGVNEVPLYAAPPKKEWVGLTKEEAREISLANRPYVIDMIAALEAKLKEKNGG